ncbi:IclR family transcriptional regulator domain-containing protein [Paracandidimonas soli]|jgi:IclR family pca regulon transcriptional regulator|uniref:IclR family transcriptional regulator domain-containing protein n=1 Tax=Paracandidimonas soli TaxID=1917182 RepID=UPI00333E6AE8
MTDTTPSTEGKKTPGDSYVQSFARGLAVIRSFSAQHPSQTMTEVAQRTGLTRAGARRILHTLHGLGYVDINGRQFRLTAKVLDLGFAYLSSLPLWSLAEPFMESFVQEVQESSSAAVLDDKEIVYVLRVPTKKIMSITLGIGSRLPAYCSSMGRVLLAGLDDALLEQQLASTELLARTPHTLTDRAALREEILRVRQQGWALINEELEEGLISLAAPIRSRSGHVVAAINVSMHKSRQSAEGMQQHILPKLLATARQISERISHSAGF